MNHRVIFKSPVAMLIGLAIGISAVNSAFANSDSTLTVIVGAPGEDGYGEMFNEWAARWKRTAQTANVRFQQIGGDTSGKASDTNPNDESSNDFDRIEDHLAELAARPPKSAWIVLIGHGTFDGQLARFNLVGRDVTANQLAGWTKAIDCPLVIVNCAAASGPFINAISGDGRTVATATKNGSEQNFARFGDALSRAVESNQVDFDKDGQTSLLEALVEAVKETQAYYQNDGRLETEHALIDDNGDGRGTRIDWFQGVRISANKSAKTNQLDGQVARDLVLIPSESLISLTEIQQQRRDEIERQLAQLRMSRPKPIDEKYLSKIEQLLIELAEIYAAASEAKAPSAEETRRNKPSADSVPLESAPTN